MIRILSEKNSPKGVLPMTKQKKLRHLEYYDLQETFDKLYAKVSRVVFSPISWNLYPVKKIYGLHIGISREMQEVQQAEWITIPSRI